LILTIIVHKREKVKWHCGGGLIKQAARFAARTSTRHYRNNRKRKPKATAKSKGGNEKSGRTRRLFILIIKKD